MDTPTDDSEPGTVVRTVRLLAASGIALLLLGQLFIATAFASMVDPDLAGLERVSAICRSLLREVVYLTFVLFLGVWFATFVIVELANVRRWVRWSSIVALIVTACVLLTIGLLAVSAPR